MSHHKTHEATFIVLVIFILANLIALSYFYSSWTAGDSPEGPAENGAPASAEDEQRVLATPKPGATDEDRQAHYELAVRLAQDTGVLTVRDCKASPTVLRVKDGGTFRIKNLDDTRHTLGINPELTFTVEAGATKEFKVDFGNGPGLYGFGCDSFPTAAGLFLVTPQ